MLSTAGGAAHGKKYASCLAKTFLPCTVDGANASLPIVDNRIEGD